MKKSFGYIYLKSRRLIVVHLTCYIKNIIDHLKEDDLVFFDDCLYSQYVFIKDNIENLNAKNINCVLGFSSMILRDENTAPVFEAVCSICHDKFHDNDMTSLNAYMTLSEIHELLSYDNIYLACHGANHLNLESLNIEYYDMIKVFSDDISLAVRKLEEYGLKTNIFVYPYAFDFKLSDTIVHKYGFTYIFAGNKSKRTEIENLISNGL